MKTCVWLHALPTLHFLNGHAPSCTKQRTCALQVAACLVTLIQPALSALQATQEVSPPSSIRARAIGTWCAWAYRLCQYVSVFTWFTLLVMSSLGRFAVHAVPLTALDALLAQVGNNFPVSLCSRCTACWLLPLHAGCCAACSQSTLRRCADEG